MLRFKSMKSLLISLIFNAALERQIDPYLALSVAIVESNLNQSAIGSLGEVGAFQLRPELYLNNETDIEVEEYVQIAMDLIGEKIEACGLELFPACYNMGITGAKRLGVERALNGPYTTKVRETYKKLTGGVREFYEDNVRY